MRVFHIRCIIFEHCPHITFMKVIFLQELEVPQSLHPDSIHNPYAPEHLHFSLSIIFLRNQENNNKRIQKRPKEKEVSRP